MDLFWNSETSHRFLQCFLRFLRSGRPLCSASSWICSNLIRTRCTITTARYRSANSSKNSPNSAQTARLSFSSALLCSQAFLTWLPAPCRQSSFLSMSWPALLLCLLAQNPLPGLPGRCSSPPSTSPFLQLIDLVVSLGLQTKLEIEASSAVDWSRCSEQGPQMTGKYHRFEDYPDAIATVDCNFGFAR